MKNFFILAFSLFYFQHVWADEYLLKPSGKYEVGFQDFRFVNGSLLHGSYSCPGKTDLYFGLSGVTPNDFGTDNKVNHCREMMVRIYYPIKSTQDLPYANYYTPSVTDLQKSISAANVPEMTERQLEALKNIQTFTVISQIKTQI